MAGARITEHRGLLESLPVLQRMALAYCPATARLPTLALLSFDSRLAALVRSSSEPMLAQLRLAWWREVLGSNPATWPQGDPLLAGLCSWEAGSRALIGLVDGWEAMTASPPISPDAINALANARGEAFAALAELVGSSGNRDVAERQGRGWALVDIATRLSNPDEKRTARMLAECHDWSTATLSRRLRPLTVLHGMAARSARSGKQLGQGGLPALAVAIRLGLLGR